MIITEFFMQAYAQLTKRTCLAPTSFALSTSFAFLHLDFDSANLVPFSTTPAKEPLSTLPRSFSPTSNLPYLKHPNIDVYSYGVLLSEVVTKDFNDPVTLQAMVRQVQRQWPLIHPLVTSTIQYSTDDRSTCTMAYILEKL